MAIFWITGLVFIAVIAFVPLKNPKPTPPEPRDFFTDLFFGEKR